MILIMFKKRKTSDSKKRLKNAQAKELKAELDGFRKRFWNY